MQPEQPKYEKPTIVILPGTKLPIGLDAVSCNILTPDLCVLRVDFSPRYKEAVHRGTRGDNRGCFFSLKSDHPEYSFEDEHAFIGMEGWDGPTDANEWNISVEAYRSNTIFWIAIYRTDVASPPQVDKAFVKEW